MVSPSLELVREIDTDAIQSHADTADTAAPADSFDALEHLVGVNLARLRAERQLSLDAFARASGVSRAMLAQIESARSVPSIKVLCKVAGALKVSVAAFLRRHAASGIEHLPAERAVARRQFERPLFCAGAPSATPARRRRIPRIAHRAAAHGSRHDAARRARR